MRSGMRMVVSALVVAVVVSGSGRVFGASLLQSVDVFVEGGIGGVLPGNLRSQTTRLEDTELQMALGWHGAVGLSLSPLRLGFRLGSHEADVRNVGTVETAVRSSMWLVELQADGAFLGAVRAWSLMPYAGFGLGRATYRYREVLETPAFLSGVGGGGADTSYELPAGGHVVWSATGGVSYRLFRRMRPLDAVAGYRFVSGKVERSHAFELGLRLLW